MLDYRKDDKQIVILTLDMAPSPVNLLGSSFIKAWTEAVDRLEAENELRGVILTSARKDFIAGADLDELYAANDPAEAMAFGMSFKRVARRFECLGVPTVAAINGTALGGGFEVALAAHHRITVKDEAIRIGFPEVTLGLFPAGGGTQRLPRMIGLQAALELLLEGRRLRVQEALEKGLVDSIAPTQAEMMAEATAYIESHPAQQQPWDQKGFRYPGGIPHSAKLAPIMSLAPSMIHAKTQGNYPAQEALLSSLYEGALVDFDTADRMETRYFAKIVTSQVFKNMLNAFWYQLNGIKKGSSRPKDIAKHQFKRVGILGAGMMGAGIAYACASRGIETVLKDLDLPRAEAGKAYSQKILAKRMQRGSLSQSAVDETLNLIKATDDLAMLADCDLVIEAVFEDRELKASISAEVEGLLSEDAIFGSNTSTLPITNLAQACQKQDRFIGIHFFSPVDKMKLVEIIVGEQTSSKTLAGAIDFVLQLGKIPIVVKDRRGFYTTRVFCQYLLEGLAMVGEGIHPRLVESAAVQAGMPVGPLKLADELSLTLIDHIKQEAMKDLGDQYQPHPGDSVVDVMLAAKRKGKKFGGGFYDYGDGGSRLWPGLGDLFCLTKEQPDIAVLQDRLLFVQALETVRCMDEGVVQSEADANIGSIFGWGFAAHHGGTVQFIKAYGVAAFMARAKALTEQFGDRFAVPDGLTPNGSMFSALPGS